MLKHNENLESKEKVKYDLYKILRLSILLNQNETDILTLTKFKEASLNIDKMLSDVYDEKIESMFYNTTTLEEEEKRLKDLVAFITDRIEKRKTLLEDYRSVTNRELNDLEYIYKSSELDLYEDRLNIIKEYLDNSKLIEINEKDLELLKEQLVKEYDLKSSNELKNMKLEDTLYNMFIDVLYEMDMYSSIEVSNIDNELEDLQQEIKETKEQKDTFTTAFDNLKSSGISGDLELEYASYVENSKRNYYYVKEKEIILKLYKLINEKESEYSNLYSKREDIKELLNERLTLRKELNIKEKDFLSKIFDLLEEQEREIEEEKDNVDNINVLTERIKLKENRLEELRKIIKKPEILSILKEYALIDTYNHDDLVEDNYEYETMTLEEPIIEEEVEEIEEEELAIDLLKDLLPEDDETTDEELNFEEEEKAKEEEKEEKEIIYQPNQIKESSVVPTMNFGLSRLKSISVMKRVADMLGISVKKEEQVVEPIKEEEIFIAPEEPILDTKPVEEVKTKDDIFEQKGNEDLFWTPGEFAEMKNETNDINNDSIFINQPNMVNNNDSMFEFKMPEINQELKANDIFETNNVNNELIFPEPAMPELGQILPENKEDKFMWPENAENFDINGIFPN